MHSQQFEKVRCNRPEPIDPFKRITTTYTSYLTSHDTVTLRYSISLALRTFSDAIDHLLFPFHQPPVDMLAECVVTGANAGTSTAKTP